MNWHCPICWSITSAVCWCIIWSDPSCLHSPSIFRSLTFLSPLKAGYGLSFSLQPIQRILPLYCRYLRFNYGCFFDFLSSNQFDFSLFNTLGRFESFLEVFEWVKTWLSCFGACFRNNFLILPTNCIINLVFLWNRRDQSLPSVKWVKGPN